MPVCEYGGLESYQSCRAAFYLYKEKLPPNKQAARVEPGNTPFPVITWLFSSDLMQSIDCSIDAEAMKDLPENIKCFVADVADSDQVDAMFEQILPGGLDILVNNAGVAGPTKLVEDISNEEWRQCMAVGIDSQFYCVRRGAGLQATRTRGNH